MLVMSVPALHGVGGSALRNGPHKVKLTVPLGGPSLLPITVAVSVLLAPCCDFYSTGLVVVVLDAAEESTVSISDRHELVNGALFESPE